MKTKLLLLVVPIVVLVAALAGIAILKYSPAVSPVARPASAPAVVNAPLAPTPEPPVAPAIPPSANETAGIATPSPAVKPSQSAPPNTAQSPVTSAPATSAPKQKPPIQDPTARAALSYVGADPEAEAYWEGAINDPTLPANERKDLIEDLNEDGLSDPHRPGPGDMPLIASRIQLIEELAPFAMDEVNAKAFAEAYKDLINLASGKPAD